MICGSPSPSKRLPDDGTTSRSLKTPRLSRHRGLLISHFSKHQTFAQGHSSTFTFSLCIFLGSFPCCQSSFAASWIFVLSSQIPHPFASSHSIRSQTIRSFTELPLPLSLRCWSTEELLDTSGFAYPSFSLAPAEQHCRVVPYPRVRSPNLGPRRTRRLIKRP
jgi:hypothetical protein